MKMRTRKSTRSEDRRTPRPWTAAPFVIAWLCLSLSASIDAGEAASGARRAEQSSDVVAIPFILDAQRILMNVSFARPDGAIRHALVWLNMGMPAPVLTKALYRELRIDRGEPLNLRLGEDSIVAAPDTIVDGDGGLANPDFNQRFSPYLVEAMIPAGLLRRYVVTIDYQRRILSLAAPGARKPEGTAVPFAFNEKTGLIAVDAVVDGAAFPMVVDAGSGYSWMRGDMVARWLAAHPDWRRAEGAVGPANYNMLDYDFEKQGTIARIPQISVGAVDLKNLGVLGTGPVLGRLGDSLFCDLFWDNWQKAAPGPAAGWLGANALKPFKLSIDFPNRVSYWRAQTKADAHDLDQVGVTLVRRADGYFIGGIVRKADRDGGEDETVEGVEIGDELIAVNGLAVRGLTRDQVLSALHGAPDEARILRVSGPSGAMREIAARVAAFD